MLRQAGSLSLRGGPVVLTGSGIQPQTGNQYNVRNPNDKHMLKCAIAVPAMVFCPQYAEQDENG